MIAVITGGTGFIGSHLVAALRATGARVRVLRRPESGRAEPLPDDVETHVVDLADAGAVMRSPVWEGATHCFHLGAATRARSVTEFERHNVVSTRHLAAACASRGAVAPRFVLLSSLAAAGPASAADRPRQEGDTPSPVEPYGVSKLAAENVLFAHDELPVTVIRAAAVYGPRDRDFLEAFRQAQAPVGVYAAPADQAFSMLHVDDMVRAIIAAAHAPVAVGRTYFVGGDRPVTWRDLYGAVAAAAGTPLRAVQLPAWTLRAVAKLSPLFSRGARPPLVSPAKVALAEARWWTCDSARIRAELGWRDEVGFADGVRATYGWYCEAGWLPRRARRVAEAA